MATPICLVKACLHTNVVDLSRWAATIMNHGTYRSARVLQYASFKQMLQPLNDITWQGWEGTQYGWGFMQKYLLGNQGPRIVEVLGGTLSQGDATMVPEEGIAVVALANLDDPIVVSDVAYDALSTLRDGKCCRPVAPMRPVRCD